MRYAFRSCELDDVARTVVVDGSVVKATPKALDLVLYLIRNRTRVVSKEELIDALWPDVQVTPASLSQCLRRARRAVGDDGGQQAAIRTFPGRGYSFVADVQVHGVEDPSAEDVGSRQLGFGAEAAPFVGRDAELVRLDSAIERVLGGQGGLVLLSGEAGVGKTTLARACAGRARRNGVDVVWADAGARSGTPPFWAWVQVVGELVAAAPDDALDELLGPGAADLGELIPTIREVVPDDGQQSRGSPEQRRARLIESLLDVLYRAARQRPRLLVLDDVHWSDRSSIMILELLAQDLVRRPLLVLATGRTDESGWEENCADSFDALIRVGRCLDIPLAGLDAAHIVELAALLYGVTVDVDSAAYVHRRTDGVPLFVRELLDGVDTAGRATSEGFARALRQAEVPTTVATLIGHRFAELGDSTRRMLQAAAVLGNRFSPTTAGEVAEMTVPSLSAAIREAESHRIVCRRGPRYEFSHALVREVVYEGIPQFRRSALHESAAGRLEEADVIARAEHLHAAYPAVDAARVLEALMAAATHSASLHAHDDAIDYYERVLSLLEGEPDAVVSRAEVLSMAAESYRFAGRIEQGRSVGFEAAASALAAGDGAVAARAAISVAALFYPRFLERSSQTAELLKEVLDRFDDLEPAVRARATARLAYAYAVDDAVERRVQLFRTATAHVAEYDSEARFEILTDCFFALFDVDHVQDLFGMLEKLRAIGDEIRDPSHKALHALGRAVVHLMVGELREARSWASRLSDVASVLRLREYRLPAQHLQASIAAMCGDFARADECIASIATESQHVREDRMSFTAATFGVNYLRGRIGFFSTMLEVAVAEDPEVPWRLMRPLLLLRNGDRDAAASSWEEIGRAGLDVLPPFSVPAAGMPLALMMAETSALLGDRVVAAEIYPRLAKYERQWCVVSFGCGCTGSVSRHLGLLAATLREWDVADEHFRVAAESHQQEGAKTLLAMTQIDWGRMLLAWGDEPHRCRGAELVRIAEETLQSLGIVPDSVACFVRG